MKNICLVDVLRYSNSAEVSSETKPAVFVTDVPRASENQSVKAA